MPAVSIRLSATVPEKGCMVFVLNRRHMGKDVFGT